ncbi:hypothetical protein [Streptomyces roseicoloratus]|uniref:hypothetical protein n=1 Tax=Streptomyces roseicoloratus TaxID=2508722 RepID=UPI00100986AB|nr:hypothetical protein [Streptomyces roseicoloratus]
MSETAGSTTDVRESRQSRSAGRIGTAVCSVVLVLGHLVTGYVALTAFMVEPDGPWDRQAVANAGVAAGIALAFSVVTALLSWVFVKAEWLRRWWYLVPAALAISALLRLTVLAPEL